MLSLRAREDRVEGGELSSSAPAISENRLPRASMTDPVKADPASKAFAFCPFAVSMH